MDQQIHFLEVPDGRIAYALAGEGAPLVLPTGWFTHLERDWEDPSVRAFFEALAATHTVVRYDRLGTGLSDRRRPAATLTLEAEVEVLSALLDQLGIERASLFGISYGGCVAIAFAARNPARAERLLLYGSYADGNGVAPREVQESIPSVIRAHWGLGSRVLSSAFVPDDDPELSRRLAEYQRAAADPETAAAMLELVYDTDVREAATSVSAPTLVVHRREDRAIPFRLGRELAALIPGAELVELEGRWHQPWFGDTNAVLRAASDFLGLDVPSPPRSAAGEPAELSPREAEVLGLVAEGLSDREIAERLVISPHTVHRHVANVRAKLRQPSRAAAAAFAARAGLI